MKYRFSHIMEYGAVRAISGLFVALPHRAALGLAWGPARLIFALNKKLRFRTYRRLRQALGPDRSDKELRRIAWIAFRNLTFTAVETLRLPGIRESWVKAHMDVGPIDVVREEMAKNKRGLVVAVPHLGNWELAALAVHSQGLSVMTLARKQKNPLMDAWIYRLRMSTGVEAIDTKTRAIGDVSKKLAAEQKMLALLPDVRAKIGGIPVTYLGASITVPGGAAKYAREAGVPVFTSEVVRKGWMRHSWGHTGRIEPDLSLSESEDRERIMQYIMDRFAESVQAYPENYFWFNKRWVLGEEKKA